MEKTKNLFGIRFSLLQINIFAYLVYVLSALAVQNTSFELTHYLESLFGFVVIFVLGGLNTVAMVQVVAQRKFSRLEYLNIAAASGLIIIPLINFVEILFFGQYGNGLVFLNSIIIYLITTAVSLFVFLNRQKSFYNPIFQLEKKDKAALIFLGLVFVIYLAAMMLIVTAYYALPDSDPYYWLLRTQECVSGGIAPACFKDRPFFEVFNILFVHAAKIDVYGYFKYVFPLLPLIIIFPAVLVSKKAKTFVGKLLLVLLPLSVPSTMLYLFTPMPQAIAIILSFYFLYWLLFSCFFNDELFYYLAGVVSFLLFWFHEVGILLFGIWFLVLIIKEARNLYSQFRSHRSQLILYALLFLFLLPYLKKPFDFASYWITNFLNAMQIRINLFFPAAYVNIDGNSMGWAGILGVLKYYMYYVGPIVILVLIYLLIVILRSDRQTRRSIFCKLILKQYQTLFFAAVIFIVIAEIFPRLFGYAFLPERIWIFGGIMSFFVLALFIDDWERSKTIKTLFILSVMVGFITAIYINQLKKNVLPDYRIKAAQWISESLPENRVLFSNGDDSSLKYYSQSRYFIMPKEFSCDKFVSDSLGIWKYFENDIVSYVPEKSEIERRFKNEFDLFVNSKKNSSFLELQTIVQKYANLLSVTGYSLTKENLVSMGYIYYYKEDPGNPYLGRPYSKTVVICDLPIFDKYPNSFRLIYDDHGMVKIWKILK